jgi:uncharacterized protein (TIGR00255 family)
MAVKYSMTGYGRAEGATEAGDLVVEIRAVNHRSLDLNIRGPREIGVVEPRVRATVRERLLRGRVEVFANVRHRSPERVQLKVDMVLARKYRDAALALAEELELPGDVSVDFLLRLPDVLYEEETELNATRFWKDFSPLLNRALDQVVAMRREEGAALVKDIRKRLRKLDSFARVIGRRRKAAAQAYRRTLETRLNDLLADADLDSGRLEQEVAFLLEKSDISEELVRVESHLKQFRLELSGDKSIGRPLDFLCQELIREVNTMGSKANDIQITRSVLSMKAETEKIREQVQNLV